MGGTITVGTTAGMVMGGRRGRGYLYLRNRSTGGQTIYIGFNGAPSATAYNFDLEPDEGIILSRENFPDWMMEYSIFAIASAASGTLSFSDG